MSTALLGRTHWSVTRDKDGHRDYSITWRAKATDITDGPATALSTPGLPAVGSTWSYGGDSDAWALCWPTASAKPVVTREGNLFWDIEQLFTTRPMERCQDAQIDNPVNEPDKIRGTFVKYQQEVTTDKDGNPLRFSNHEMIRGAIATFDHNRPTVSIEKHLATLPLSTFAPMVDTVNSGAMWGLSPRMVKLSNATWRRHFYGLCSVYYTVTYDFDIDYTTFDRFTWDQGTKVLSDGGDINDPRDFEVYKDVNGENTTVLLNGAGRPLSDSAAPVAVVLRRYAESNFFLLGIPASL